MRNAATFAALAALTPETIVALEGVGFAVKARSIPGVVEASESFGFEEVAFAGAGEDDLEMIDVERVVRLSQDHGERMIVLEGHIVAGGLCYDRDVGNPSEEMDGEGRVRFLGRRGSQEDRDAAAEALGLNSDMSPNFTAEAVCDALADQVIQQIRKDRSLMATLTNLLRHQRGEATWQDVFDTIRAAIHQEGPDYAMDYVAEYFFDARWWDDLDGRWKNKLSTLVFCFDRHLIESAWETARANGKLGNPLAVLLDVYEHGGIVVSLSGEGMQCRWDTSSGGAVWIPDSCAEENIRSMAGDSSAPGYLKTLQEKTREYAKSCLGTYNQWLAGDIYGVCVYVIDRKTGSSESSVFCRQLG